VGRGTKRSAGRGIDGRLYFHAGENGKISTRDHYTYGVRIDSTHIRVD
jgi:hypothetical protein